ncbi:DUF4145 domain-containing protein [Rhizobium sp. CG5]|uniref:DUF4145 domain-containing protein n=1 Tax=Rhizobium sp. CG5 TaxID=2726076 RepID=UPI0020331CAF|nr:DUF4145 domain-containing protein [Rhizobium sp. CG5]MCM2475653.1 DUF4145 domain-containing protein [Rhizobium sp. CG5]
MNSAARAPTLGKDSFCCPHCGAYAHQDWHSIGSRPYEKDERPWLPSADVIENIKANERNTDTKGELVKFFTQRLSGKPFLFAGDSWDNFRPLHNMDLSICFSCSDISIWLAGKIIYPEFVVDITLNPDTPLSVVPFLEEARKVFPMSPRCAAAMLRLSLQKLCIELGESGENINTDIKSLVKKGLDARVIKALDIVRIVGNNAVHPGEIEFGDNDEVVLELFRLVDIIVTAMITQPRKIDEIFDSLPEGPREATKLRDQISS